MAKKNEVVQKAKNVEEVGTAVTKQERQEIVREGLIDARKHVEEGYLELAELLAETYHKEFFREWGFSSFEDYCIKELDFQYRKAMYLVEIWDKAKALNLPKDRIRKLGWTKMKELVQVMTAENAAEWLKKAKDMSTKELIDEVKVTRHTDPTANVQRPQTTKITFTMSEAEAAIILEAIEEAKGLCDTENPVIALEMICQDWMQSQGSKPTRSSVEGIISYVEKAFGVKLEQSSKKKETAKADKKDAPGPTEKKASPAKKEKKVVEDEDDDDDLLLDEDFGDEEDDVLTPSAKPEQDLNELFSID